MYYIVPFHPIPPPTSVCSFFPPCPIKYLRKENKCSKLLRSKEDSVQSLPSKSSDLGETTAASFDSDPRNLTHSLHAITSAIWFVSRRTPRPIIIINNNNKNITPPPPRNILASSYRTTLVSRKESLNGMPSSNMLYSHAFTWDCDSRIRNKKLNDCGHLNSLDRN